MELKRLTSSSLKTICDDLSNKICFNHMSNVTIINSFDLFITFSMFRKEKLLISLAPNNPFLSLADISNPVGTKIGQMNDALRKELKDGYILEINTINNDRIVEISYSKTNDYFGKEKRYLILELIPYRPNLIILNEDRTILFAFHYTDMSSRHPIIKKLAYSPLENKNDFVEEGAFDLDSFKAFANKYYLHSVQVRLQEQFKPVIQHIRSRIKALKRKIVVLLKETEEAKKHLSYQEIGQMILTYADDQESLKEYIAENDISYDQTLTPGMNANKYFNKYKKAKRTIEVNKQELEKTKNEIAYLNNCLIQSEFMNEEDIIELSNLLFPNKFKLNSKKKIEAKPGEIKLENGKIYYGKNAKQNDLLTFKKANKDDLFFHVKDIHGSHVILSKKEPTNQDILLACEVALILSKQEMGEIQSTKVKNIKKGSFLGQAILSSYQTYNINEIRQETKDLFNL